MTTEEAIETLKTWRITGDRAHEALSMAIKALVKQIPMKPGAKKLADEHICGHPVYVITCGSCGNVINFLHLYCPWCGQALTTEGET